MAQHVVTDQPGVRFGLGVGALFTLTDVVAASGFRDQYAVALLLLATTALAAALDVPHALLLGLAGWGFATGFVVNALAVLTVAGPDLLRLGVFVAAAVAAGRTGGPT